MNRVCALCSQPFIALDIVLRYRDTETPYVFCPHERWTPPRWSEHAPSSVGHDPAGGRGA